VKLGEKDGICWKKDIFIGKGYFYWKIEDFCWEMGILLEKWEFSISV
jgi:hypothetical protein